MIHAGERLGEAAIAPVASKPSAAEKVSPWRLVQMAAGTALLAWAVWFLGAGWLQFTAITLVIMLPAERFLAANPQKLLRANIGNEVSHWFSSTALFGVLYAVVSAFVVIVVRRAAANPLPHLVTAQPFALQFGEAVLITYFCVYWAHRMAHAVPWIWRFHAVHHSAVDVNWTTAARFHPVDLVIERSVALVPLVALGFPPSVLGGYLLFEMLQSIFVHANVRVPIGPLRWVIATPEFHRWHHADDPAVYNKNFCELPLMDVLFGTAHMPRGERPQRFGVRPRISNAYVVQLLRPFAPPKRRGQAKKNAARAPRTAL